jgi:hypothetical protein
MSRGENALNALWRKRFEFDSGFGEFDTPAWPTLIV